MDTINTGPPGTSSPSSGWTEANPPNPTRTEKITVGEYPKVAFPASLSVSFPFRRDGFDHRLIEQIGRVCLIERSKAGHQLHYEVIVLQKRKARILPGGAFLPEGWAYPAGEQWGEAGWTCTYFAEARRRYLTLVPKRGLSATSRMEIAELGKNAPGTERRAA
jgi:hypothetical protein